MFIIAAATALALQSMGQDRAGSGMNAPTAQDQDRLNRDIGERRPNAEPKDDCKGKACKKGKISPADAKLINATNDAGQAKMAARDFAGAVAEYQKGIDAAAQNPALYRLYAGLGMALRRQAVAEYNNGGAQLAPPAPGAGNDAIRAYNATVRAAQAQRSAAAAPYLERALTAEGQAATLADAQTDKSADETISLELRESARLLYAMEPTSVQTKPRASIAVEATWLRRWMGGTPAPSAADLVKFGYPVAAAQIVSDREAGLTLADEIQAKGGTEPAAVIAYAEVIAGAKLPAGDPRRTKATAAIQAVETSGTTNDAQKAQIRDIKAALGAPA